ncbi:cytochrome P450, putative [Talaromyces stipitatus ATCC 10500]|uniref:Cytochrome P450, putative n=1 Tax=Talaromyces stipitatus (strain ATCC 10500 / CBS 375.48 / QM 6759 / NRRL 1006) TaxID=441959 RepID=B8MPJ7_TALSN|nr:cytochrome P450, putative [Talaromyces stipitatus ATCC 10500]EED14436.1 cytochrome P450, putative [Talaromyces stipitatus ATCC 10500]
MSTTKVAATCWLLLAVLLILIFPMQIALSTTGVIVLSSTFIFGIWKIYLRPFWFSPLRHLPEPKGGTLFNGHAKLVPNERSGMPLQEWINEVPNNGLIRYRMMFNKEIIFVTSPKALSEVLVQKNYDFSKPYKLRQGLGRILGIGLIIAEGEEHKKQRKLLMPAFLHRPVKDLYPIFWEKSVSLAAELDANIKRVPGEPSQVFDVADWLARTTLDILGAAGLGREFDTLHNPENEIVRAYRGVFEQKPPKSIFGILVFLAKQQTMNLLSIKPRDSITTATEVLTDVSRRLIKDKKDERTQSSKESLDVSARRDILSVALDSGNFTDTMLENHLLTFLAAGHETTATSMTWALYALCLYPEVQQRLREEVRSKLPIRTMRKGGAMPVTAELVDSLPYLHAVCNEVFRIYPPAGLTRRVAAKDTSILDQHIPQGTVIVISPRAVNISKDLWGEDALVFNPDRWMKPGQANSGGGLTNFSFMTFLHGPRSCIGQGFARGEFACLLAALVGSFKMELEDNTAELVIETGLTSRPKDGLRVRLRPILV